MSCALADAVASRFAINERCTNSTRATVQTTRVTATITEAVTVTCTRIPARRRTMSRHARCMLGVRRLPWLRSTGGVIP